MKVVRAFKHLFIPHEHNDYKPHFFREVSVSIIVVSTIFMLGFSAGSSFLIHRTVLGANISANVLIDLTNENRLAYNEEPLVRNPVLDAAAQMKADDMAAKGYFAHVSPEGVTPWHWFEKAGYTFLYAGENLAINFTDAKAVQDAWMASPKHRENILDVKFKEIGMATLTGVYEGGPSIYVVQMFGTPAKALGTALAPVAAPVSTTTVAISTSTPHVLAMAGEGKEGEIKGASASNTPVVTRPQYEPLITTSDLAIVKNNNTVIQTGTFSHIKAYSTWFERFLFGGSYYVDVVYRILIILVTISLLTMVFVEIRRQHWKHISYGLGMLLILTLSLLINQSFF